MLKQTLELEQQDLDTLVASIEQYKFVAENSVTPTNAFMFIGFVDGSDFFSSRE